MTYRNSSLLKVVHEIECVHCGKVHVQAAHANLQEFGKGMGIKASDAAIMSLCPEFHVQIDQGKNLTKEERRNLQYEFIAKTYVRLMERGLIKVVE